MSFSNIIKRHIPSIDETVYTATHKSGLRVVLIKKPGFNKRYATFSTKYGATNVEFVVPGEDKPTKVIDGIAHFLEHKVFEMPDGTNAFDKFSVYGANANAFTSFNVTNYLFSATDHFYENLEILLNFVQTPYFTDENVNKEKGIIAQEIRMYEDDADQTCFYNCLKAMYKNHPVRKNIAGTVEEIMKTTPELLYKCYNTFYHPSNMALICVGDIDENELLKVVDKTIRQDKAQSEITQIFPEEPDGAYQRRIEAEFDVPMPMFMLGFKDSETGGSSDEMLKREVLTQCILQTLFGSSSKFYTELYDKGIVNGTFGTSYEYEESCAYASFMGESEHVDEIEKEIFKTLDEARKNGLDEEDFRRAKKMIYGRFLSSLDSPESLGDEYMFAFHRGLDLFDYADILEKATVEDALKRLDVLFKEENAAMSIVNPKGEENDK